ncbi:hypothetical protein SeLEV6574_g02148 [Synchytrium endobioticum]|uniref:Actin cytoskeleton-regulatory complex protein SLA1 n=1 Tax=Synchytrium endobioticum TaxID=286115 RepID=A0A507D9K7_9FUNG|nr:hypothetical protein SeLEV6574_g02148 [Synchytrium endobioticum]
MKVKKVCRAAFDFHGNTDCELNNVKEGDFLLIIDDGSDDKWLTARHRSQDAFADSTIGLIPANYVQDAPPVVTWKAIYQYEARTDDEISFPDGASIDIYERNDPEWWLARYHDDVGLIPAVYVSEDGNPEPEDEYGVDPDHVVPEDENQPRADRLQEAAAQKAAFLSAIEPLGPPKAPGAARAKTVSRLPPAEIGPELMYYSVIVDEKKIKKKRNGLVGADTDTLYFISENDRGVLNKWLIKDTKTSLKGKRLTVHIVDETIVIEGDKVDLQAINKKLEESSRTSRISRPMHVTLMDSGGGGPPPIMDMPSRPAIPGAGPKMAVAIYDYVAKTNEELSIQENENLMVLDDSDPEWIKVRIISKGGRAGEGLVPYNYIEYKQRDDGGVASGASIPSQPPMPPTALPARPKIESAPPAMPQRPQIQQAPTPPPMAPRPAARPGAKSMDDNSDKPDPSKVRMWTDKTGSFKVEAQLLSVTDGKVHLHKVNGVRITVPLEKLDSKDCAFINTVTGGNLTVPAGSAPPLPPRESLSNGSGHLALGLTSPPRLPLRVVSDDSAIMRSNGPPILVPAASSMNHSRDAEKYAARFVTERLDKTILEDVDRETFKALGVTEGDIIRIRKHAPLSAEAAVRENKVLSKNDAQYARRLAEAGDELKPMDPKRKAQMEKEDEEFARMLQAEEMGIPVKVLESSFKDQSPAITAGPSNVRVPQPPSQPVAPVATTSRRVSESKPTIDQAKILAASKVLGASIDKESNIKELVIKGKESQDDASWTERIAIKESLKDVDLPKKRDYSNAEEYKSRHESGGKQQLQRKYLTDSHGISSHHGKFGAHMTPAGMHTSGAKEKHSDSFDLLVFDTTSDVGSGGASSGGPTFGHQAPGGGGYHPAGSTGLALPPGGDFMPAHAGYGVPDNSTVSYTPGPTSYSSGPCYPNELFASATLESSFRGQTSAITPGPGNVRVAHLSSQHTPLVATTSRRISENQSTIDQAKVLAASKVFGASTNNDSNSKELVIRGKESHLPSLSFSASTPGGSYSTANAGYRVPGGSFSCTPGMYSSGGKEDHTNSLNVMVFDTTTVSGSIGTGGPAFVGVGGGFQAPTSGFGTFSNQAPGGGGYHSPGFTGLGGYHPGLVGADGTNFSLSSFAATTPGGGYATASAGYGVPGGSASSYNPGQYASGGKEEHSNSFNVMVIDKSMVSGSVGTGSPGFAGVGGGGSQAPAIGSTSFASQAPGGGAYYPAGSTGLGGYHLGPIGNGAFGFSGSSFAAQPPGGGYMPPHAGYGVPDNSTVSYTPGPPSHSSGPYHPKDPFATFLP